MEAFTRILDTFEKMSGQSINLEKSIVYFSPNTLMPQCMTLGRLLKMKVVDKLDGYLGLPIPVGKKKFSVFQSILDHTASRINSWSKCLFSNGGKEIFFKSILQAIPTYTFSVFLAPKGVLDEIQSMISQVWWGEGRRIGVERCCLGIGCVTVKAWMALVSGTYDSLTWLF